MKKAFFSCVSCVFFVMAGFTQSADEKSILGILDKQTQAWNRGDLEAFMKGYWENDSLMYIGQGGVTYGYNATLNSYKKNYGDTARMGKLNFEILHVKSQGPDYYFVVGKWFLKRSAGDVGGHYTLIFKKINGAWVIISDHSS
ncbi:MAG: YybH family protein [Chitinophagaceae bacterium]